MATLAGMTPSPSSSPPAPTPTPSPSATRSAPVTAAPSATPTTPAPSTPLPVPLYTYQVVHEFPHDPTAFTQGLDYVDGILIEGTGRRGQSTLRRVDLDTGQVLQSLRLPDQLFGEGVTVLGDKIYQLTWQENIGFVYDRETFALLDTFSYPTEGWGLTHDGQRLIMSDGTANLYFLDPMTLQEIGRVEVRDPHGPVTLINELEYVEGEVFANVWRTDWIARIDPGTGQVTGWIDLAGLLQPEDMAQPVDVLNGIAYDEATGRLFVTGKLWPKLFEIRLAD